MIHNGIEFAAAPSGGLTELQSLVWVEQCIAMTGFTPEASWRRPVGIQGFAEALARQDWVFRVRMLQEIILIGMLARPATPELDAKLRAVARALSVGDEIIDAIERFGQTSYDAAVVDFARNGYVANFAEFPRPRPPHRRRPRRRLGCSRK